MPIRIWFVFRLCSNDGAFYIIDQTLEANNGGKDAAEGQRAETRADQG